ncbi:MAG: response regulator [Candidatus Riflebacteria bacterium]|nr:response regulator [Candidatus Riflebacteria bacterium]
MTSTHLSPKPASLADRLLAIEVFSELLASTAPAQLGQSLTEQIRELSGARTILLISRSLGLDIHKLLYACPPRRAQMFSSDEQKCFCPNEFSEPLPRLVSDFPTSHPLRTPLIREGIQSILRFLLRTGGELIGTLVLLDLPDSDRIDETAEIISQLSPVIALALKNSLAFERIEKQSLELEKQSQELERRVAERTADLEAANHELETSRQAAFKSIEQAVDARQQAEKTASALQQEVNERKQAEDALAAEKERLNVTLRSIADGVITTDIQGNVVIINKVAEKLTGWTQTEALGKPLTMIFHIINQLTRKPCVSPVLKILSTGAIEEQENHTVLISRDGTERIISESGAPIRDKNSVTIGIVVVFHDRTGEQKLLDALQRNDKLDALGVLAGGIAHDFNNLLAGIFGYIDLAYENCGTNNKVSNFLFKALQAFERAKNLTQQLLTFSKGGLPVCETGNLSPTIRESSAFALSGSNIICEFDISQDLWLVDFDKNQIGQVIDNLVINARQAMPNGGKIIISAKNIVLHGSEMTIIKGGRFVKISVIDTGIGIPPANLKRIFDPFFTTKLKGNGLGLATCYSIIQKHHGYIDVESVLGKGTTFSLYFPASMNKVVSEIPKGAISHKGSGNILIMDDEAFIREILSNLLKEMGYQTIEAKDGNEALQLCMDALQKGNPINGAFLDLTIPGGKGGRETIVELRKLHSTIPIYSSSGFSEDPLVSRPTEFGFTDSIRKPYRKEELVIMLNRHNPENK